MLLHYPSKEFIDVFYLIELKLFEMLYQDDEDVMYTIRLLGYCVYIFYIIVSFVSFTVFQK